MNNIMTFFLWPACIEYHDDKKWRKYFNGVDLRLKLG